MPELTLRRSVLMSALKRGGLFTRKASVPILEVIRLVVDDQGLHIEGTDLDNAIRVDVPDARVTGVGSTCVMLSRLLRLVAVLDPAFDVVLSWPGGRPNEAGGLLKDRSAVFSVAVASGPVSCTLFGYDPDDFPSSGVPDDPCHFTIGADQLHALLEPVRYAMSTEETRYYLNGVYLHVHNGLLCAVATDGHRLALRNCSLPPGAEAFKGGILHQGLIGKLVPLLRSLGTETVALAFGNLRVEICCAGLTISARLIDGTFPDYRKVLPPPPTCSFKIQRRHVMASVARMRAFSGRSLYRALRVTLESAAVRFETDDPDNGHVREVAPVDVSGDPGMAIGFNPHFLADAIRADTSEDLCFELFNPGSPVVMRGEYDGLSILMPMRI